MEIEKEVWALVQKEIVIFSKKLEEVVSDFCGFKVNFPLRNTKRKVIMDVDVDFPVGIPLLNKEIAENILARVSVLLEQTINNIETIDYNRLHTIVRDISLSIIFDDFITENDKERMRYIDLINELKEIGAKTYESNPVDIGVIYCKNENALNEVISLNVDIIPLSQRKSIKKFFLEEKPLLRLIDNKSLVILIDSDFNVIGLVRKIPNEKSLSNIIESKFNDWAKDDAKKNMLDILGKQFERKLSSFNLEDDALQSVLSAYAEKLEKLLEKTEVASCPSYIYFSIHNKNVSIYSHQKFIITYFNGEWKLKHYNLMLSGILTLLASSVSGMLISMKHEDFNRMIDNINTAVFKLLDIVRSLSQKGTSSIFVIVNKNNSKPNLNRDYSKKFLINNGFKNNNLDKTFLEVIYKDDKNLNLITADHHLVQALSSIDGAVILDNYLNILSFGEIINVPKGKTYKDTYGTGTKAARYSSRRGIAIKISEDGDIYLFSNERLLLTI
jgi:hypothetical protein